jgi:hypothetical protein
MITVYNSNYEGSHSIKQYSSVSIRYMTSSQFNASTERTPKTFCILLEIYLTQWTVFDTVLVLYKESLNVASFKTGACVWLSVSSSLLKISDKRCKPIVSTTTPSFFHQVNHKLFNSGPPFCLQTSFESSQRTWKPTLPIADNGDQRVVLQSLEDVTYCALTPTDALTLSSTFSFLLADPP